MSDLVQELIDAEREGWQTLASGRGVSTIGRTWRQMPKWPSGVMSRQEAIDAVEAAPPWASFDLVDPQVVELPADTGIVVYRVSAHRAGEEPYAAVASSTFIRGYGRWLLAFHQQSPV